MSDEEDRALASPFILWVNYGSYEGWKPRGYTTMEDAQRAIADCAYSSPCIVTGPVLFPPKKETA